jgi:xanthine dehydrogenase YagS FAD-binding subunit
MKAMDRKVWTFALAGVAAAVRRAGPHIEEARIVLTGVAPVPWRAYPAEEVLLGKSPNQALFEEAAGAALEAASPLARNGYKIPLLRALIRRALATVCAIS